MENVFNHSLGLRQPGFVETDFPNWESTLLYSFGNQTCLSYYRKKFSDPILRKSVKNYNF